MSPMSEAEGHASTARKVGWAASVLILAVLLSRVLGFLRDAYIAARFGANGATDAFYAAFTIPDLLNYLVAGGTLSITFIPIYARHLAAGQEAKGNRAFAIIATIMGGVVILGILGLEWSAPALVATYLRHLDAADRAIAVDLTRILVPAQLFFYLGGLCSATLFARHRFVAAALAPLVYNLGTIAGGVLLGGHLGIAGLAWGTLAGAIVGPFVIQAVAARRAGLRYRPAWAPGDVDFRAWVRASLPLMIGVSLVTADEWIIKYFAAGSAGAISCLSYARKLVLVPIAIAGQAVGQASMPFFARLAAEGKRRELGALVTSSARASGAVAAVMSAALAALAVPAVEILFHRGAFLEAQVAPTALYTAVFAAAIPVWAVQGIVSRAFYAVGDTLTPMVAGTVVTVLALPIYALLSRAAGPLGLALASGLGIGLHGTALLLLLGRRVPECDRRDLVSGVARGAVLGIAAAAAARLVLAYVPMTSVTGSLGRAIYQCALGGIVFGVTVMLLARPLGAKDLVTLIGRVLSRLPGRLSDRFR